MSEGKFAPPPVTAAAKLGVRKRILILPADSGLTAVDFDEVFIGSLEKIADRYQLVLPVDDGLRLPIGGDQLSLAFLCREEHTLAQLSKRMVTGDILFQPSAATILDLMRRQRQTLVMAVARDAGHVLTSADLATERGGSGIGLEWRQAMVGRRLLYPVSCGQAVDFGYISEDFEEHRQ